MKTLYVFLLCLYTSLTVAAQPLCQIKHFSVNSGLSQGVVVNIMQDKKGFLWFATWRTESNSTDTHLKITKHFRETAVL